MSANQIQIISTSTIKVDSTARINLTTWDLEILFFEFVEMGLLFFKPNNTTTTPSLVHHLKSSLHRALQFFQPLAGRLTAAKISSLQAVVAHLWRSILRCRFNKINSLSTDQQMTSLEIPMNVRPRLNPPLPEEYFGNAVFPGTVILEVGKILENSVGWIAWQINRVVAMNNSHEKLIEFYMSWIKKPKFLQPVALPPNYFAVINSPRFHIYGNDFGSGKPVAARCGRSDSFDGRITVSAGLEEGSLEIEPCLLSETLSKLVEDKEFMEFVTLKC